MFAFPSSNAKSWTLWSPFQIKENWDSEKVSHFPKVIEFVKEASLLQVYVIFYPSITLLTVLGRRAAYGGKMYREKITAENSHYENMVKQISEKRTYWKWLEVQLKAL